MIKDEKRSVAFSEMKGWLLSIQKLNYSQYACADVHVSFFSHLEIVEEMGL